MKQIVIFALEPLENRYTSEWFTELPRMIQLAADKKHVSIEIFNISGTANTSTTSNGQFLDFKTTNIWKNEQTNKFFELVNSNRIKPGAKLLFPDAWNPCLIQVKYINDLLDMNFEIHAIFHSGSYDPNDFLGRKVKDKNWSYNFERSIFYASNYNYFATNYHIELFIEKLGLRNFEITKTQADHLHSIVRSGLPFDYLKEKFDYLKDVPKEDIILFPHRIAPEKQLNIFKDLEKELPQYRWVVCQEHNINKDEYRLLLAKSKLVFSANLQETLGIGTAEGIFANTSVLVPERLSYLEMYRLLFTYPSEWTESWDSYIKYKELLKKYIVSQMKLFNQCDKAIQSQKEFLYNEFFNSEPMFNNLLK